MLSSSELGQLRRHVRESVNNRQCPHCQGLVPASVNMKGAVLLLEVLDFYEEVQNERVSKPTTSDKHPGDEATRRSPGRSRGASRKRSAGVRT